MSGLVLPAGAKSHRALWRGTPEPVPLGDGRRLFVDGAYRQPGQTGYRFTAPRGLVVLASYDATPKWGELLHVSVSEGREYPGWDTVTAIKAAFFGPDVDAMMVLPKEADYIHNASPERREVFHLWETPEGWGLR